MNKVSIGLLVAIVLAAGAWYAYSNQATADKPVPTDPYAMTPDLGMYPYVCDNGSTFILSPLEGLANVQVSADAQGMFTGTATLALVSGTEYEGTAPDGQSVMLHGDGETVHLTVGSEKATCTPKADSENAPWNWGGAQ